MNRIIPARPERKAFTARRLALLASAAGLAIAVVATGTSGFSTPNFPSAIATAHADTMQRSTGFADVVEKVKPAVVSVRVKVDATAKMMSMNDNDEASTMQPEWVIATGLVDASMPFLQMGVANPLGLYMYVLQKGFGVKDVGPLVMRPEQAPPPEGDPSAQQMQPPPEGEQPPPMNAPTQAPGDAPGQFPPGEVPPPGPTPMDQMAAMAGGGPPGMPPQGGPPPGQDPMQALMAMLGQQPQGPPAGGPESLPPELLAQMMGQMPPQ